MQRVFRGRRGRARAEAEAMRLLYAPPPSVLFDGRGELRVCTTIASSGGQDWKLSLSFQSMGGRDLEQVAAMVGVEVRGGERLVYRTLHKPPFVLSSRDTKRAGRVGCYNPSPWADEDRGGTSQGAHPGANRQHETAPAVARSLSREGSQLAAKITIRWAPFFQQPPATVTHSMRLDGESASDRMLTTLRHPDMQARPRLSVIGKPSSPAAPYTPHRQEGQAPAPPSALRSIPPRSSRQ